MKKKLCSLFLTALCAVSLLCGCSAGKDKGGAQLSATTPVTLNEVAHSIFYAPLYVAIEEGYFAEEGIELTLVTGFGADKTMTALLTDEADIGFMGSESTIYTYIGGASDYAVNFASLLSVNTTFTFSFQLGLIFKIFLYKLMAISLVIHTIIALPFKISCLCS